MPVSSLTRRPRRDSGLALARVDPVQLHCVDETGALQLFDDRFERMVAWEAGRRPDATRAELEASTLAYMATMPAWRDHPRVAGALHYD